jgi:hypothetical protein
MVFEVSGGDQAGETGLHESRRLGLSGCLQTGVGDLIADRGPGVCGDTFAHYIQQVRTHPGISQVRSDARTHGSRAEDGDFLNSLQHW